MNPKCYAELYSATDTSNHEEDHFGSNRRLAKRRRHRGRVYHIVALLKGWDGVGWLIADNVDVGGDEVLALITR